MLNSYIKRCVFCFVLFFSFSELLMEFTSVNFMHEILHVTYLPSTQAWFCEDPFFVHISHYSPTCKTFSWCFLGFLISHQKHSLYDQTYCLFPAPFFWVLELFWKCGLWSSFLSILWECLEMQILKLQNYLTRNSGVGFSSLFSRILLPGDSNTH